SPSSVARVWRGSTSRSRGSGAPWASSGLRAAGAVASSLMGADRMRRDEGGGAAYRRGVAWFAAAAGGLGQAGVPHARAALYLVAFVAAARQGPALIGSRGLTPVPAYLRRVGFRQAPSLFHRWWSDRIFLAVCWTGAALAVLTLVGVTARLPLVASMAVW